MSTREETCARERERGTKRTYDVSDALDRLPHVLLLVIAQEVPCASRGPRSASSHTPIIKDEKLKKNSLRPVPPDLEQEFAHLELEELGAVEDVAPHDGVVHAAAPLDLGDERVAVDARAGRARDAQRRRGEHRGLEGVDLVVDRAVGRHEGRLLGVVPGEVETHGSHGGFWEYLERTVMQSYARRAYAGHAGDMRGLKLIPRAFYLWNGVECGIAKQPG